MTNKLNITDLSIEVTRRCNMACRHCMRGVAQNKNVDVGILDALFANIGSISTLNFTGGEPSLYPKAMESALYFAKKHGVSVHQIYVVTNGKRITEGFLKAIREWDAYCIESSLGLEDMLEYTDTKKVIRFARDEYEPYGAIVSLSMDQFHEPMQKENLLKLLSLPRLTMDKYNDGKITDWVLGCGRASDTLPSIESIEKTRPYMFDEQALDLGIEEAYVDNDVQYFEADALYLNAENQLLKYCDYSYQAQKEHAVGCICGEDDTEWLDRLLYSQGERTDK